MAYGTIQTHNGCLLVGGFKYSGKYLSIGMIIPNIWKNKNCSKPPTSLEKEECGTSKNLPKSFIEAVGQWSLSILEGFHVWTRTVVGQLGMDQDWIPQNSASFPIQATKNDSKSMVIPRS